MSSLDVSTTNKSLWFIDSRFTSHMSKNELIFHTLEDSIKTKVGMGNGEKLDTHGKGSVSFQTKQDTKFIHNVVYVPCLPCNL